MNTPFKVSYRERDDAYQGALHRSGRWRIIICKDGIQYIIQKRASAAGRCPSAHWRARHYCTTRRAALRLWEAESGDGGEALEWLPERAPLLDLSAWQTIHETA